MFSQLQTWLTQLVVAAGLGQIVLIMASLAIPHTLGWRAETAKLRPLTRQVFWTYAGYIWTINLGFGLLSVLAPSWLLDRSPLAGVVAGFISVYWGARVAIQFAYFDRSDVPPGSLVRLAEAALVLLFVFLTLVYGLAAAFDFGGLKCECVPAPQYKCGCIGRFAAIRIVANWILHYSDSIATHGAASGLDGGDCGSNRR